MQERVSQANHGCAGRARCQPERFGPRGQAAKGKPRSEPDWGNPAVRDRREARGNVAHGRPRNPARKRKRGAGHPGLQVHAPRIYPDFRVLFQNANAAKQPPHELLTEYYSAHHGGTVHGPSGGRTRRRGLNVPNPVRLDCCCEGLPGEMARTRGGGDLHRVGMERWTRLGPSGSAQRQRPRPPDAGDQATEWPVFLISPGGPATPPP
jgi:hypothetical protein